MEVKSSQDFYLLEKRVYKLRTFVEGGIKGKEVERMYRDFEWLQSILTYAYPGVIVPPVPEKTPLAKLPQNLIEQMQMSILSTRKKALAIFLKKVLNHP